MPGEITKAGEVNDQRVAEHLAAKGKVDKEVASDHKPNADK